MEGHNGNLREEYGDTEHHHGEPIRSHVTLDLAGVFDNVPQPQPPQFVPPPMDPPYIPRVPTPPVFLPMYPPNMINMPFPMNPALLESMMATQPWAMEYGAYTVVVEEPFMNPQIMLREWVYLPPPLWFYSSGDHIYQGIHTEPHINVVNDELIVPAEQHLPGWPGLNIVQEENPPEPWPTQQPAAPEVDLATASAQPEPVLVEPHAFVEERTFMTVRDNNGQVYLIENEAVIVID